MSLSLSTEYAVRLVLFLAQNPGFVGREELVARTGTPATMVVKVAKPLQEAGILTARRGNRGGFALARHPAQISMADIILAAEGHSYLNPCLAPGCSCALGRAETCPIHAFYQQVQRSLEDTFAGKSVADLLAETGLPLPPPASSRNLREKGRML